MDLMQRLYESEINSSISSFWDGGFHWRLGDAMNGFVAEGQADSSGDAEEAMAEAARRAYPNSDFARDVVR